jgi:asparagine synthase (glutamine-hydrolysing)
MLTKVDRASMMYSLEVRSPFLDYRLVEMSQKINLDMKCHNGVYKYPLKQILYKYVPKDLMERPKKGFGVPINKWLHDDFKNIVGDYLLKDFVTRQNIFNTEEIAGLYKAFMNINNPAIDRIIWCLLVFQMWWDEWC